jgi:hypothetical protein
MLTQGAPLDISNAYRFNLIKLQSKAEMRLTSLLKMVCGTRHIRGARTWIVVAAGTVVSLLDVGTKRKVMCMQQPVLDTRISGHALDSDLCL